MSNVGEAIRGHHAELLDALTKQSALLVDEPRCAELRTQLGRLALQLEASFAAHLRKEEETYLPLFEAHLTDAEQAQVMEGMHAVSYELDVRTIPPPQRHGLIFQAFADLARSHWQSGLRGTHDNG